MCFRQRCQQNYTPNPFVKFAFLAELFNVWQRCERQQLEQESSENESEHLDSFEG